MFSPLCLYIFIILLEQSVFLPLLVTFFLAYNLTVAILGAFQVLCVSSEHLIVYPSQHLLPLYHKVLLKFS